MPKPVIVEYRKGPRTGETYVVRSAADAERVHPDATILSYEDGTEYHAPKANVKNASKDGQG